LPYRNLERRSADEKRIDRATFDDTSRKLQSGERLTPQRTGQETFRYRYTDEK
jgi:hypothetical protein